MTSNKPFKYFLIFSLLVIVCSFNSFKSDLTQLNYSVSLLKKNYESSQDNASAQLPIENFILEIKGRELEGYVKTSLVANNDTDIYVLDENLNVFEIHKDSKYCTSEKYLTCNFLTFQDKDVKKKLLFYFKNQNSQIQGLSVNNVNRSITNLGSMSNLPLLFIAFIFVAYLISFIKNIKTKDHMILISSLAFLSLLGNLLLLALIAYTLLSFFLLNLQLRNLISLRVIIAINILILLVFKYSFFSYIFFSNSIFNFLFPIGMSYLFLRVIDTSIKIAKGKLLQIGFIDFSKFILVWPAFSSGPVTEYEKLYIRENHLCKQNRKEGLERSIKGVFKKSLADLVYFAFYEKSYFLYFSTGEDAFLFLTINLIYLYLSFSGYTDMAIGCAKLMGIELPENFNKPFYKNNLRDFWKSWHMSLGNWVNRNVFVFVSLDLRREKNLLKVFLPLFLTMLIMGMWHGLYLTWLLWGIHHAVGIVISDSFISRSQVTLERVNGNVKTVLAKIFNILGILFVWFWFVIGMAFTQTNNIVLAVELYFNGLKSILL
tara:strand:- start:2479 stop:4110 length:1632 start_codon:yes stop_codon:yes gene_type:complete